MELLDVVDENNNLTGEKEERSIIHEKGIYHREVAVWIMNKKGEILLQKRAATKKQHPNKWALCAGHVDSGETVEQAIVREMEEEIGMKVTIDDLEFLCIYNEPAEMPESNIKNFNFKYMYFLKTDWKIEDYKIRLEELSEVRYIPFEEFERMIKNKDENVTFSSRSYMRDMMEKLRARLAT